MNLYVSVFYEPYSDEGFEHPVHGPGHGQGNGVFDFADSSGCTPEYLELVHPLCIGPHPNEVHDPWELSEAYLEFSYVENMPNTSSADLAGSFSGGPVQVVPASAQDLDADGFPDRDLDADDGRGPIGQRREAGVASDVEFSHLWQVQKAQALWSPACLRLQNVAPDDPDEGFVVRYREVLPMDTSAPLAAPRSIGFATGSVFPTDLAFGYAQLQDPNSPFAQNNPDLVVDAEHLNLWYLGEAYVGPKDVNAFAVNPLYQDIHPTTAMAGNTIVALEYIIYDGNSTVGHELGHALTNLDDTEVVSPPYNQYLDNPTHFFPNRGTETSAQFDVRHYRRMHEALEEAAQTALDVTNPTNWREHGNPYLQEVQ